MSKHATQAKRISKQNYCTFCKYRIKTVTGTKCDFYGLPINEAMNQCDYLTPFDRYKEVHGRD